MNGSGTENSDMQLIRTAAEKSDAGKMSFSAIAEFAHTSLVKHWLGGVLACLIPAILGFFVNLIPLKMI